MMPKLVVGVKGKAKDEPPDPQTDPVDCICPLAVTCRQLVEVLPRPLMKRLVEEAVTAVIAVVEAYEKRDAVRVEVAMKYWPVTMPASTESPLTASLVPGVVVPNPRLPVEVRRMPSVRPAAPVAV